MTVNSDALSVVSSDPQFYFVETDASDVTSSAWSWAESGFAVRILRGWKMKTTPDLMSEFAAALQFPYYFGENWPALDECLSDLEWLPFGRGVVITILAGEYVLSGDDNLPILVEVLERAMRIYANPIDEGESWDRPAVPFHVVIQAAEGRVDDAVRRWKAAGAHLAEC